MTYKVKAGDIVSEFKTQDEADEYISNAYANDHDVFTWRLNYCPEYDDTPMSDAEFETHYYSVPEDFFDSPEDMGDSVGTYDEDGELRDEDGGKMNTVR